MWTIFFALMKTLVFNISNALAPPDFISSWKSISAYINPEVDISHGLNGLPLKVEVQVKVFDTFLNKDMWFLATGSAQRGNDNALPFGGVLYVYNNETIKIMAPGPKDCTNPYCTGSLVYLGNSTTFNGNDSITRSFSVGHVRARVWRACSLPRPQFISEEIQMSSGDFKSLTNGHTATWVIVRVHTDQGWVYEAQGSVFYETSSHPFGGVVFAFSDSQIRLWVPKRGAGSSSANGVPFNAINGWGESGDFGYSETVRVRAFVWDFKSFNHTPIVLEQTSYITSSSFISVPAGYSFQDNNNLLLFSIKAESGNNQGYQFYPAGSSMTDGTTDSNNTKFGSFIYGFTDDKIYYWTPYVNTSGCVLLLDGLWVSQNQQHCLSKNDVALMITFNVLTLGEPACGVFPCANASDRGPECNCKGSEKEGQFCDNETTDITTVKTLSTSISSQSDDTTNFTTVERLSASPSPQRECTDFGYNTRSLYMEPDCFEIKTLFGTNHKDENDPLLMLITNDNTITSKGVVALICQNSHRDYSWDLWRKLQKGTYIKDKYFTNPANQPKSAAISFGKESIPEGNYLLRMVVNLTDSGQCLEDEIYIEFKLPPIITSIHGGSVRYISKYNDLVIDAGPVTYDKVQKYKSVPFDYEWCCRKGLNQSQVDAVLGKFGLPGAPDIITLGTSCNESSWGAKWTIPSENLSLDTWYLLLVKTKKITNIIDKKLLGSADTIRSATALQAVKVQIGHTPTINILCRRNCLPKLSLNSLLILNADCPECSLSDTKYEWSILVYNHTTEVFDSLSSVPSINQSRLIVTSN